MNLFPFVIGGIAVGGLLAIVRAVAISCEPQPPPLSPAIRRAMREDCRRKGL